MRVEQAPSVWWQGLVHLLRDLAEQVPSETIVAIAVDGTSGTVLLTDANGEPLTAALMYNDARAEQQAAAIAALAPPYSAAHGASSGLAKLLYLKRMTRPSRIAHALSQADWITGRLLGRFGISDANNSLKLGFDPVAGRWPAWIADLGLDARLLPQVVPPGTALGRIGLEAQRDLGLCPHVSVVAGTTDSTAAFLASGASRAGEGVTSLGSTLVCKVLAHEPVFAPEYGVYSQPLGELWLAGGGSNTGGAVLRRWFDDARLEALSQRIRPERPTGFDYYPLLRPGERFPVNDPHLPPRLEPRPEDDAIFLQGILEGMAHIEYQAYAKLAQLGAPYPQSLRSVGGGAANPTWAAIRASWLRVPMVQAVCPDAAYGAALLARRGSS